ncbi:hypothetical protein ACFWOY_16895 [Streptomyces sp. NPDC058423]|uniref:hypothetical protein n=1 Tax=unclassified Streptomyces TaxID=2593676 RepID=UPI003659B44F
MRHATRRILVPALTALALAASGCSAGPDSSDRPQAGPTPAATAAAGDGTEQLDVEAAPRGEAAPTAVARRTTEGTTRAAESALKVAAYDKRTRRAVIATPPRDPNPPGSGSPTAGPTSAPTADAPVKTGDVIASAPAPGAPDGLLAEVTEVLGTTDRGTEVRTAPTTLSTLLADDKADGQVPVDPSTVDVEPLVKGVKVSWARTGGATFGPNGSKLPLGSLRLDVGAAVATADDAPVSAAASLSGFVQLAPQVEFSYDGSANGQAGRPAPGSAFLGMTGDWTAQWALKGRASAKATQRIPFAKLHADPVIQVGPVPVVVNLDLTCYLQVEADGRITLDVQQDVRGDFRVGGAYAPGDGWTPVSTSDVKSTPVRTTVTAAGQARATLGAEASVGLYGMVGLTADFAPYLRAEAQARADAATDGTASVTGTWAVHGGFDLSGNLQLQLAIFGTPILQHRIPLGSLHREWPLASGKGTLAA